VYSINSDPGRVVRETVPVVALICICRLVGAEHPHFWSSLAMAMLICGSSLAELGKGMGVARVEQSSNAVLEYCTCTSTRVQYPPR